MTPPRAAIRPFAHPSGERTKTFVIIVLIRDARRTAAALIREDECLDVTARFRAIATRDTSIILRSFTGEQWDFGL
jgi:hypothetical protein